MPNNSPVPKLPFLSKPDQTASHHNISYALARFVDFNQKSSILTPKTYLETGLI